MSKVMSAKNDIKNHDKTSSKKISYLNDQRIYYLWKNALLTLYF